MFTESTTFRPRNGLPAECYWRLRAWCYKNGFSLSDVLNAMLLPISYSLDNYCLVDVERNMATVELNAGDVPIFHVVRGGIWPLRRDVDDTKDHLSDEEIQRRIDHWKEKNSTAPNQIDLLIGKTLVSRIKK